MIDNADSGRSAVPAASTPDAPDHVPFDVTTAAVTPLRWPKVIQESSAACRASADGSVAEPGIAQIGPELTVVGELIVAGVRTVVVVTACEPSLEEHAASDVANTNTAAAAARPSRRDPSCARIAHLDSLLLVLIIALGGDLREGSSVTSSNALPSDDRRLA